MAGFLGWIRLDGGEARVADALTCLRHHPSFRGEVLAGDARGGVAVLYRPGDPPEVHRIPERGLLVAILGAVLEYRNGQWHRYTAAELAAAYLERGLPAISGLDGSYQLLIRDEPAGRLHFFNDRIGSRYMQYARTEAGVAFAPEAKALFRLLPLKPRMDFAGMVSFLNLGYPIGTCTLFEGVRLLAPAHRWTLDLRTGAIEQARTWVQRFEPDRRLTLRAAADLLFQATVDSHRAPLGRGTERPWIALTGGYDSRTLLGVLERLGAIPAGSFTWGARADVPYSDPVIAQKYAARLGLVHRFLPYAAKDFETNVYRWLGVSEAATDNLGYYAAGPQFVYFLDGASPDAIWVGDLVIASGNVPRTVDEAVETVTRVPSGQIIGPLQEVLTGEGLRAFSAEQKAALEEVASTSPSAHPENVQDFLWGRIYNFRWLFSPGFYREPMANAWRPMLLGPMYDSLAVVPARWRAYKRVWVEILRRYLPDYARIRRASTSSLIDWECESRQGGCLALWLTQATCWSRLQATPLARWLDQGAYFTVRQHYLESVPCQAHASFLRTIWAAFRRQYATTPGVGPAIKRLENLLRKRLAVQRSAGHQPHRLFFRLAILGQLCELMKNWDEENLNVARTGW